MMELVKCDVGSVCIKCGDSFIHYSNGWGDGEFAVYIFENSFDFSQFLKKYSFKDDFIDDAVFKNAKLMNYDLCYKFENNSEFNKELTELNGWFGIYRLLDEDHESTGNMAIVGWGE